MQRLDSPHLHNPLPELNSTQRIAWWRETRGQILSMVGLRAPGGQIALIGRENACLAPLIRAEGGEPLGLVERPDDERSSSIEADQTPLTFRSIAQVIKTATRLDLVVMIGVWTRLSDPWQVLELCLRSARFVAFETAVEDRLSTRSHQDRMPTAAAILAAANAAEVVAFPLFPAMAHQNREPEIQYAWPIRDQGATSHLLRRSWLLCRRRALPAPEPRQISVVVQGPVFGGPNDKPRRRITASCLHALRHALPESELILSTWRGAAVEGLDFDRLVESDDPGSRLCDEVHKVHNNVNRQLVSTQAGMQLATRPFCLKIRSDLLLQSARFLDYWRAFPARDPRYQFTADRMLNCSVFARRFAGPPRQERPVAFHPSDFLFFGWTSDVRMLFDVPAYPLKSAAKWFANRPLRLRTRDPFPTNLSQFLPEQWLWIGYLRRWLDVSLRDRLDFDHPAHLHDRPTMLNNLVMLDQSQWSFLMPKYLLRQYFMADYDWPGLYRHEIWRADYRELLGQNPTPHPTYDSRVRWWLVDNPMARLFRRHSPTMVARVERKLRKAAWIR
jgi:hypothetical protein